MPTDKKLLTTQDMLGLLNCSKSMLAKLVSQGEFSIYKLGAANRFDEDEVYEWLELHRVKGKD